MSILRRLNSFFRKSSDLTTLSATIKGEKLYTFKNIAEMPLKRQKSLLMALKSYEYKISCENMDSYEVLMEEAINEGNMAKVGMYHQLLKAYRSIEANEDTLFEIANICTLVHGESVNSTDEKSTDIKRNLFDTNDEARFFFILFAMLQARTLEDSLSQGIITSKVNQMMAYLNQKEVKNNQQIFLTQIGKEKK